MRTILPIDDLSACSEAALRRMGFLFYKHQTRRVVEFEVTDPVEFLVRIENLSDDGFRPEPLFGILGGSSAGNAFSLIVQSERPRTRSMVSSFVTELLSKLPKEPWDGLGFIEKRTSKAYWSGLMKT